MKRGLIFLLIVGPMLAVLYFGLTRDPRILPSALLDKPAPGFALAQLDGGEVSLATQRGRPVVLNFWSTWCGPCAAEHQFLRSAMRAYSPRGVAFYSVLYEDTPENARAFVGRYGAAAPILLDAGLKTAIDYGVAGVPETYFIDGEGIVRFKHAGVLTPDVLVEALATVGVEADDDGGRP